MTAWTDGPPEPCAEEREPRTYVTEVGCPPVDDGVVRGHVRMKAPEPEPEARVDREPEAWVEPEPEPQA